MSSSAFSHMATDTITILRSVKDGSKFSEPTVLLEARCFPIAPVSNPDELRETYRLGTLTNILDTFVEGDLEIRVGDIAQKQDGTEYPIRACIPAPFRSEYWTRLVLDGLVK